MAGIRGRVRRARRDAQVGGIVIELRDGSRRVFDDLTCQKEMFLATMDLYRGNARASEVLEAVRQATPESRAAFEARYGSITPEVHVIAADYQGGWVEVYKLEEDATVTRVRHEGGTPEAERIREQARQGPPAF